MAKFAIDIKMASQEDAPAILEITKEAFEKYAYDLGERQKVAALKEKCNDVEKDILEKNVLVGYIDDECVGTIRYEILPSGIAYISRFGVKLKAQSCGMGGALVRKVVSRCREMGITAIALHTSARMSSLIRFYYGNGFFIHSTAVKKGYIRALLIKELIYCENEILDYTHLVPENY